MNGSSKAPRVVIVGAGPGGLATAMLLAHRGVDVTIVEKSDRVGGRTRTLIHDGFHFDLGPTFFLYPRVLEEIFQAVGRDLHAEIDMVQLDPQYRIVLGTSGDLLATPDVSRLSAEVAKISPRDAGQVQRFLDETRAKLRLMEPCLEMPYLGWKDVVTPRMLRLLPVMRPWLSLDGELSRYFQDPRIRLAFAFQSKYLGMSPFSCPSLFSILSFLEYEYGVFHPIGGCGALSEVMSKVAEQLGAKISLNDTVEEVLFEGRRAVGVRSSTGVHQADAVVVNADFSHAMTRLVPNRLRRRWTDERIARKRFSCSTFMLYLGVEGRYDDIPHHTIYITDEYASNLEDIEKRLCLTEDPSFYVQNACVTDPGLAPEGCSTLYVLVPTPHMHPNVDWSQETPRYRELALRQLKKVGIDGLEERIRYEKIFTPADWERLGIYKGATFNLAHNLGQMLHLRPRNRFEDVDGMYLVGGGTHPGSGLPVIFESARITSRLLATDLGVSASQAPEESPAGAA